MAVARRALVGGAFCALGLAALAGCGWAPLYADRQTGPADAELRAIKVAPIPERIGQRLAWALRSSLNPGGGEPVPQRYLLQTTLQVVRVDLGIQTQGFGTQGRLDVYATILLTDIKSNAALVSGTNHVAETFSILANDYSNVVAEDDAKTRAVAQLSGDITSRLTLFMQNRASQVAAKP
jgi:LPS-assembly lipoprotein